MHACTSSQQYAYVSTRAPVHVHMSLCSCSHGCVCKVIIASIFVCARVCASARASVHVHASVCADSCAQLHGYAVLQRVHILRPAIVHVHIFCVPARSSARCVGMRLCQRVLEHARALAQSNEEHLFLAVSPWDGRNPGMRASYVSRRRGACPSLVACQVPPTPV